jgi:hypothetical protein
MGLEEIAPSRREERMYEGNRYLYDLDVDVKIILK